MIFNNIKRHIPQWVGWLIILKGLINLGFGILTFFWARNSSWVVHYFRAMELLWNFSVVKSFTAILIGVGYISLGRGLLQGKRLAWQISMIWLGLNLLDSLIPRIVAVQVLYVLIMMGILWFSRDYFNKKTQNPLRPQQSVAFLSIIFVLAYGIIGCYLLRNQYQGIHNLVDAVYYSLETYSTIGYGDIIPLTTNARIFTCSMIILGVGSFIAAVSILFGPAMEQRINKVVNMVNKLNTSKDHVIILGATTLGLYIAKTLKAQGDMLVIIDPNTDALKAVQDANFKVISSDLSPEEVLESAGIKTAKALVCALDSDAKNLLAAMVANKLRRSAKLKLKIIVRVDEPQNMEYATQNGADQVIAPAVVLGEMVAKELASTKKN